MHYPHERFLLVLLTVSAVWLAGCSSLGGGATSRVAATTRVEYYPACYQPVSHLRSSEDSLRKAMVTGAVTGGLLGGVAGLFIGDDDDRARNTALGAVTGALAGGAAAYYNQRQKQIADDRLRIASYGDDIERNRADMNRSIAYAQAAQDCYRREFNALRTAHKSGRMSDSEGRKRLAEILSGLKETNALLAAVDGRAGDNLDTYTQAYEQDLKQIGVERQAVIREARAPSKAPATGSTRTRSVPKEAVKTEVGLTQANAKRAEIKTTASRGESQIREVCNDPDVGDWGGDQCSSV